MALLTPNQSFFINALKLDSNILCKVALAFVFMCVIFLAFPRSHVCSIYFGNVIVITGLILYVSLGTLSYSDHGRAEVKLRLREIHRNLTFLSTRTSSCANREQVSHDLTLWLI